MLPGLSVKHAHRIRHTCSNPMVPSSFRSLPYPPFRRPRVSMETLAELWTSSVLSTQSAFRTLLATKQSGPERTSASILPWHIRLDIFVRNIHSIEPVITVDKINAAIAI